MQIDLPDVVAAVRSAFERYEQALVSNNVAELDTLFHHDVRTIRYGIAENLYGHAEVAAFRARRSPQGLSRTRAKTVIRAMVTTSPSPPRCFIATARLGR
jgi:Protein of unknown function (DUF3225)